MFPNWGERHSKKEFLKLVQLKFRNVFKFRLERKFSTNFSEFKKLNILISEFNHTFS